MPRPSLRAVHRPVIPPDAPRPPRRSPLAGDALHTSAPQKAEASPASGLLPGLCGVRQWGVTYASAARAPFPRMRQSATPGRKRMRHANTEACFAPASELSTDLSSHRTPHALPVGARSRAMPFTPMRHKRQKHRPRAGSYRVCVAFDSGAWRALRRRVYRFPGCGNRLRMSGNACATQTQKHASPQPPSCPPTCHPTGHPTPSP